MEGLGFYTAPSRQCKKIVSFGGIEDSARSAVHVFAALRRPLNPFATGFAVRLDCPQIPTSSTVWRRQDTSSRSSSRLPRTLHLTENNWLKGKLSSCCTSFRDNCAICVMSCIESTCLHASLPSLLFQYPPLRRMRLP